MAVKPALALYSGQIAQLQPGDQLAASVAYISTRTYTNGEASAAIVIGAPVYASAAGAAKRAQANAPGTAKVIGLGQDVSLAAAASGNFVNGGVLVATTAQWDAVTGASGGLTFNSTYWLDPATAGKLTTTAPTTVGQSVTQVGVALNSTDMEVMLQPPILL